MNRLTIAQDLSFPLEIGSRTTALFGIRGSGKTNTAGVFAEGLLDNHQPIAVIDPTDAWFGLRAGRDGTKDGGYPILIAGGSHGDIPLQETDGKVIAEFLVQEQASVILSLRHLRKNAQRRFVTEFCEELYHLKGRDQNRTPLTVFIDEAPLFVPQKVMGEVARTVGAVEDLIARGRNAGFGVVLISQRSATLNADVRTQADTIICHRLTSPLDRKAISEWFEENASVDRLKEILQSLATLKNGEAWVWSPALDIMSRTQIRLRRTFDSSATPKLGETIRPPKSLKEIDITRLKGQLAASIEKSRTEDPKELRKQILSLKKEIEALRAQPPVAVKAEAVEVSVLTDEDRKTLEGLASLVLLFRTDLDSMKDVLEEVRRICEKGAKAQSQSLSIPSYKITEKVQTPRQVHQNRPVVHSSQPSTLTNPEQRILDAIAWMESIGVDRPEQTAVAFLAGYTIGGGGFNNPRGALRTKGLVEYAGDCIRLTAEGRGLANAPDSALTTHDLHRAVMDRLPGPEQKLLSVILKHYPKAITNEQCAAEAGYTAGAGGYNNPRGRLRTLGLIEYPEGGMVRARDILFI